MDFIRTYFCLRIEAINEALRLVEDAWHQREWLAAALMILWFSLCTIIGILLLPIDVVYGAIRWYRQPEFREGMKEDIKELRLDEE